MTQGATDNDEASQEPGGGKSFLARCLGACFPCLTRWNTGLLEQAALVRKTLGDGGIPNVQDLLYESEYPLPNVSGTRGFCNWIIPGRVMVGQYPGPSPESIGPNWDDAKVHLNTMVKDAKVGLFCCLQDEIPSQNDVNAWIDGEAYLPDGPTRWAFPKPFGHYGPVVRELSPDCQFWSAPIQDLSVPKSRDLHELLFELLTFLVQGKDKAIYVHCWGGRGRAAVVGACLLSLLYPEEGAKTILNLVQGGYNTRAGADKLPASLSESPQTASQREFVTAFVRERRQQRPPAQESAR